MSSLAPSPAAQIATTTQPSIDELDAAISRLARHLNAESHQLSCSRAISTIASVGPSGASRIAQSGLRGAAACRCRRRARSFARLMPCESCLRSPRRLRMDDCRIRRPARSRALQTLATRTSCSRMRCRPLHRKSKSAAGRFVIRCLIQQTVRIESGSGDRCRCGAARRKAAQQSEWSCRSRTPN